MNSVFDNPHFIREQEEKSVENFRTFTVLENTICVCETLYHNHMLVHTAGAFPKNKDNNSCFMEDLHEKSSLICHSEEIFWLIFCAFFLFEKMSSAVNDVFFCLI